MKCRGKEVKGIEREKRHVLMFVACSLACLDRMRAKKKKWRFRPNHVREAGNSFCSNREPTKCFSREMTRSI